MPHSRKSSQKRFSGSRSTSLTQHLFFVTGEAKCIAASTANQPERLAWLCEKGDGKTSALVLATRELRGMPTWTQDAAIANEHHRLVGNVKQKAMDVAWWKPWIHQLLLYVGSSRTGKGAADRKRAKTAVAADRTAT